MSVLLMFGGQGEERERMGIAMAERVLAARDLLGYASDLLHLDVVKLLSRGGRALSSTRVLQTTMTAVSLGALAAFRERGLDGHVVLGHSLGELAAWSAAGAIDAAATLRLATARGAAMESAARETPGGMCSLEIARVDDLLGTLTAARTRGFADLAARPSADELVVSGSREAVAWLVARGARRLPVSGAWHSRAMRPARIALQEALLSEPVRPARLPVIANDTGRVAAPADAARHLARQLTRRVRLRTAFDTVAHLGVRHVVALGPSGAVRTHLRRALGDRVILHRVEEPRDLDALARVLPSGPVPHVK